MTDIEYGHWEGLAARYRRDEAWLLSTKTGKWVPVEPAELAHNGTLLTEEEFRKRFGQVPALPAEAFK